MELWQYLITDNDILTNGFQGGDREIFKQNGYTEEEARIALDYLVQHGIVPKYNALIDAIKDADKIVYESWNNFASGYTATINNLDGHTIQLRYNDNSTINDYKHNYSAFVEIPFNDTTYKTEVLLHRFVAPSDRTTTNQFEYYIYRFEFTTSNESFYNSVTVRATSWKYGEQDVNKQNLNKFSYRIVK